MDVEENEINNEFKTVDEYDITKIPIKIDEDEKYLLNIFPTQDNKSIIYKLEKEKIQTYYFLEKYDLRDFRQKNTSFISDDDIKEVYTHIKEIIKNCTISLEKKALTINVIFKSKQDDKFVLDFTLKKKIVAQQRLNPLLIEQIQDNKSKLKLLKKQIAKLNKSIQIKTDIINDFNINISNINNFMNNFNDNNTNGINNIIEKNIGEEKIINNISSNEKEEDEISKENSSNQEQEVEEKRYISNNRKKKNKKQNKKIKLIEIDNNSNSKEDNTIFCFDGVDILGNKKAFELLVIFNIITILIILYLLCSIYSIKSDLEYEKLIEEEFVSKLSYLNVVNDNDEDSPFKQNNNNNYRNKEEEKISKEKENKKKKNDKRNGSLFENEKEKNYFKNQIMKKGKPNVKDVNFSLKYSSKTDPKNFSKFSNKCKGSDNLILIRNKEGKKYGFFSKNFFEILNGNKPLESNSHKYKITGYSFNSKEIYEFDYKNFMDIYNGFIKNIYNYFSHEEKIPFHNKYYNLSIYNRYNRSQVFGNIDEIEIYQVKYNK